MACNRFRVITLTNHDTRRGSHEPIRTRLTPSTGNASEQIEICCDCNSDWLRKCREIIEPIGKLKNVKPKLPVSYFGHSLDLFSVGRAVLKEICVLSFHKLCALVNSSPFSGYTIRYHVFHNPYSQKNNSHVIRSCTSKPLEIYVPVALSKKCFMFIIFVFV